MLQVVILFNAYTFYTFSPHTFLLLKYFYLVTTLPPCVKWIYQHLVKEVKGMGERGDRQIPGAFNQVMVYVFLVNIKDVLHNCASLIL